MPTREPQRRVGAQQHGTKAHHLHRCRQRRRPVQLLAQRSHQLGVAHRIRGRRNQHASRNRDADSGWAPHGAAAAGGGASVRAPAGGPRKRSASSCGVVPTRRYASREQLASRHQMEHRDQASRCRSVNHSRSAPHLCIHGCCRASARTCPWWRTSPIIAPRSCADISSSHPAPAHSFRLTAGRRLDKRDQSDDIAEMRHQVSPILDAVKSTVRRKWGRDIRKAGSG